MLLAHVLFRDEQGPYTELCIVPEDSDKFSAAMPIRVLYPATDAVFYVGPKESLIVNDGPNPGSLILSPVTPAEIYITPNSGMQPGLRVHQLLLVPDENKYRTFYISQSTDNEWREFTANKQR